MRHVQTVVLASGNLHKFQEFEALCAAYTQIELLPVTGMIRNADKLGQVEVYSTYLENAVAKARLVNHGCHYPALADDSGLEVMALEGRPGVRSHRFAPPRPKMSQDQANVQLLLEQLQGKKGQERAARFVCVLALCLEGIVIHAQGILEGTIAEAPSGSAGFGYDPVFIPKGSQQTLAEMGEGMKNSMSHRYHALQELMKQVQERGIILAKP